MLLINPLPKHNVYFFLPCKAHILSLAKSFRSFGHWRKNGRRSAGKSVRNRNLDAKKGHGMVSSISLAFLRLDKGMAGSKDWKQTMVSRRRADLAAFRRVNKAIVATRHFALALHEQYVKKVVEAPGVHIPAPVLKGMGLCDWAWLQRNLCFCRATACLFCFWFGLLFAWK